jgi:hypothetical protein
MYICQRQSCGLSWEYDTPDGKCPVCRGNLIPESMANKAKQLLIEPKEEKKSWLSKLFNM